MPVKKTCENLRYLREIIDTSLMTDQTLPHNDPDLRLAHHIGEYLEGSIDLQAVEDPLTSPLVAYKKQRIEKSDSIPNYDSHTLWDTISRETEPKQESAKIYSLGKSWPGSKAIWATAASLLIAAFIGLYYYTVQQPQVIASSAQSIETVVLEDGSKVTLRPHSTIFALPRSSDEHHYKLDGEAYFEVTSLPERTFSVQAGSGKVRVLGTKFNLSNWGNQVQVYLEEGSISFENLNTSDSVILSPGEAAEIEPDETISSGSAELSEFTDWMNRELIFRNKTARYVFNEMEQEFNIAITAPDSILNTQLSGRLSLEDVGQSLEDLSLVLNGQFTNEGNNRFNFVPNE